jgi:hypothetical protein
MDIEGLLASGRLRVEVSDTAELSPGRFITGVCEQVERHEASVVVIDSLNGIPRGLLTRERKRALPSPKRYRRASKG